jgi:hypothetical protein
MTFTRFWCDCVLEASKNNPKINLVALLVVNDAKFVLIRHPAAISIAGAVALQGVAFCYNAKAQTADRCRAMQTLRT